MDRESTNSAGGSRHDRHLPCRPRPDRGVPIFLGFAYLFANRRRVAVTAGWALAQLIAAERWRAGGTILIGLVAIGVAQ
jgi:hypothetical protein